MRRSEVKLLDEQRPVPQSPHVGQHEDIRLARRHQLLGSRHQVGHVEAVKIGLAAWVPAAGNIGESVRRRSRRKQIRDRSALGLGAPGIALHDRAGGTIVYFGQLNAEVDAFHEIEIEVVGGRHSRLVDIHAGLIPGEYAAGNDHIVRRKRIVQPEFEDGQIVAEIARGLVAGVGRDRKQGGISERTVRRALRVRVVVVEFDRQPVGNVPQQVESGRTVAGAPDILAAAHGKIRIGRVFRIGQRACLGTVGPEGFLAAEVEPGRQIAVGPGKFDFRIGVVERRRQAVGWPHLQGELSICADAVPFREFIADGLGHRIQVALSGTILLVGVGMRRNAAPFRRAYAAPAIVGFAGKSAPAADADRTRAVVALLAHRAERDAHGIVGKGFGIKCGHLGSQAIAHFRGLVVQSAQCRGEIPARRFQRASRADIQGGSNAAGRHVGLPALVDFHRGDAF